MYFFFFFFTNLREKCLSLKRKLKRQICNSIVGLFYMILYRTSEFLEIKTLVNYFVRRKTTTVRANERPRPCNVTFAYVKRNDVL